MTRFLGVIGVGILLSFCGVGPASAQRTPGDYALFWSYWKDACSTPTTTGDVSYGCPAVAKAQPTPTGSGDPRGSGGSGGGGGGGGGA